MSRKAQTKNEEMSLKTRLLLPPEEDHRRDRNDGLDARSPRGARLSAKPREAAGFRGHDGTCFCGLTIVLQY
ncbi:MAG: hypothetical protein Q7S07_02580 [Candidatus Omnitrophota bacterium]|nr:hypothetical protein [Candidatus Omnitrophota bacterium]